MGFNRRMMPDSANFRRQGKTLNKTTTETGGETKNGKSINNTTTKRRQAAKHDQVESKNRKSLIKKTKGEADNYSDEGYSDPDENYSEEIVNDPKELKEDQVESKTSSSKSSIKPRIITKSTTKKSRTTRTTTITTGKTFRSSLKIFLPHSSRLPIPFSENNAFCHFYPTNPICGTT
ncbi:uncharacterized protein LOC111362151 [Spodoptera litura]|uniref:Uncharacterized protein LOC111362151 n=1 Tax=Spodoptera litura TaxID=69820 RepID=A0A9J7ET86_SPOLT|nr:uncharacterized protein LOC111362151 [Spodoptera litura]